jgi:hypothetical protein
MEPDGRASVLAIGWWFAAACSEPPIDQGSWWQSSGNLVAVTAAVVM